MSDLSKAIENLEDCLKSHSGGETSWAHSDVIDAARDVLEAYAEALPSEVREYAEQRADYFGWSDGLAVWPDYDTGKHRTAFVQGFEDCTKWYAERLKSKAGAGGQDE